MTTFRFGFLKPDSRSLQLVDMEDTLENWYNLLDCRCIEIHRLDPASSVVFICDEEGKLNGSEANLLWQGDVLAGSIGFARTSPVIGGDLLPLESEDIDFLLGYCSTFAVWNVPALD